MTFVTVAEGATKLLAELEQTMLTPDEKIAVLDTASATIKSVLAAESLKAMWANILFPKR